MTGKFQRFVNNLLGKSIRYEVASTDRVADLKAQVVAAEGLDVGQQRLVFRGKQLKNGHTLGYYKVQPESTLNLAHASDPTSSPVLAAGLVGNGVHVGSANDSVAVELGASCVQF